jgi:REP element-mobilizing transposase RayT
MPQYRRADIPGATYFFTVVTYRRRPILCDEPVRAALRAAVAAVRAKYPFMIDAWGLLPDHLHCMWTLPPGDANFALRWGLIKRSYQSRQTRAGRANGGLAVFDLSSGCGKRPVSGKLGHRA